MSEYMTGALKFLDYKEDKTIIPFEVSQAATPKKRVQIILDLDIEFIDSDASEEEPTKKQTVKRNQTKK